MTAVGSAIRWTPSSPRGIAPAALVAGSLWLVAAAIALTNPSYVNPRTPLDTVAVWTLTVALVALVGPVWALHRFQRAREGFVGYEGTLLVCLGALAAGLGNPLVAGAIPGAADFADVGLAVYLPGIVMVMLGLLPLGFATTRARMLPRWIGWALMAGCPLLVLSDQGGLVPFGIAWLGIGVALGRRVKGEPG